MNFKEDICTTYSGCISKKCIDEGCLIKLDKISEDHVILKGKVYQKTTNCSNDLCNFIIFENASENPIKTIVLNVTGGEINERIFDIAYKKLQNGAKIAELMTKDMNIDSFSANLAKGGKINSLASRMLVNKKYRVSFRKFKKYINMLDCGESLETPV